MSGHPRGIQQPLVCGTGVATQTRRANTCGRTNLKGYLPVGSVSDGPAPFVGHYGLSLTGTLPVFLLQPTWRRPVEGRWSRALSFLAVGATFLLVACEEAGLPAIPGEPPPPAPITEPEPPAEPEPVAPPAAAPDPDPPAADPDPPEPEPEPEPAEPEPTTASAWVPDYTIVVAVTRGIDEGGFVTDAEWLTIVEYADDAYQRSYIRVQVELAHTVTVEQVYDVRFLRKGNGPALASAGGTNNNSVSFYMANWPEAIFSHPRRLIALGNTLAHELLHIIDRDYLLDIECEHDPLDMPTIFGAGPWLETEITFSEHVRNDCFMAAGG